MRHRYNIEVWTHVHLSKSSPMNILSNIFQNILVCMSGTQNHTVTKE